MVKGWTAESINWYLSARKPLSSPVGGLSSSHRKWLESAFKGPQADEGLDWYLKGPSNDMLTESMLKAHTADPDILLLKKQWQIFTTETNYLE